MNNYLGIWSNSPLQRLKETQPAFKLFTAEEARLQATGIKIGIKLWDFTEATKNPSDELMSEFYELINILGAIESTAHVGGRHYTESKLKDARLQQVLEACLKKLGYSLSPVLERSSEEDAPEYFQISW